MRVHDDGDGIMCLKVRLTRGATVAAIFGTWCRQKRWVWPAMISQSPILRLTVNVCFVRLCRSRNRRAAPSDRLGYCRTAPKARLTVAVPSNAVAPASIKVA